MTKFQGMIRFDSDRLALRHCSMFISHSSDWWSQEEARDGGEKLIGERDAIDLLIRQVQETCMFSIKAQKRSMA